MSDEVEFYDKELQRELVELLGPMTEEERELFVKDVELMEQNDAFYLAQKKRHLNGQVSAETFKNIVNDRHALMLKNRQSR